MAASIAKAKELVENEGYFMPMQFETQPTQKSMN